MNNNREPYRNSLVLLKAIEFLNPCPSSSCSPSTEVEATEKLKRVDSIWQRWLVFNATQSPWIVTSLIEVSLTSETTRSSRSRVDPQTSKP